MRKGRKTVEGLLNSVNHKCHNNQYHKCFCQEYVILELNNNANKVSTYILEGM